MKKLILAAGGTGGHSYPALAVAKAAAERGIEPLMLARREDPFLPLLRKEGIPFLEIDVIGLPRGLSARIPVFFWKLARSLPLILRALNDFRPDAVISMGGYVGFPAVLGAAWLNIPRAAHESNASAGLANKASLAFGAKLLCGLEGPLSARGAVVGTPVRPAILKKEGALRARAALGLEPGTRTLLVFGGSQGAESLNRAAPSALRAVLERPGPEPRPALQVIHISGRKGFEGARDSYQGLPIRAQVLPYLEEMELGYGAADLVICRSGASTISELAAQEKPALLVPYPRSAAGHQIENARVLERAGAAAVLLEGEDFEMELARVLADLLSLKNKPSRLELMAQAYRKAGLPPAAESADRILKAVGLI